MGDVISGVNRECFNFELSSCRNNSGRYFPSNEFVKSAYKERLICIQTGWQQGDA